jgi:hypothetical protein
MILYLLCPGWVRSRIDGDRHYITASQLSRLYHVPMDECVTLNYGGSPGYDRRRDDLLAKVYRGELIKLTPREDGDYDNVPPESIKILAKRRDTYPVPPPGHPLERLWMNAMADPLNVPTYIQVCRQTYGR